MERHLVQLPSAAGDRISQLPAEILDLIMGLLPIRQAARISVMSKVWRDVWSNLTLLCFDHHFFRHVDKKHSYSKEVHKDIKECSCLHVITQILLQHRGSIRKFVCSRLLAMTKTVRSPSHDMDEWLMLVTLQGVEEIHLHFGHNEYKLPDCIFLCSTLKRLHLNGFSIDPQNSPRSLPNATSLCLEYVDFGTGDLLNYAVHAPRLEKLSFSWCRDTFHFDITARDLTSLRIYGCSSSRPDKFLPDNLDLRSLSTLDMDYYSLTGFVGQYTTKGLSLQMPALKLLKISNFGSHDNDEISAFVCLLSNCPKLCNLELSLLWAGDINKCEDVTFGNLEKFRRVLQTHKMLLLLKLSSFGGLRLQMDFIREMLAWLPALEKVVIMRFPHMFDWIKGHETKEEISHFPRASEKAKIVYQ